MKEILLSQQGKNKGKFTTIVDDWNYEFLNQWKWFAKKSKNKYYAARAIYIEGKQTIIYMARVIMNTPENMEPDHCNHNTLDNQQNNLMNCTHQQNCSNTINENENPGICFCNGYYIIRKNINGKRTYIGRSKIKEEAIIKLNTFNLSA